MSLPTDIGVFYTFMKTLFYTLPLSVRLLLISVVGFFTIFGISRNIK